MQQQIERELEQIRHGFTSKLGTSLYGDEHGIKLAGNDIDDASPLMIMVFNERNDPRRARHRRQEQYARQNEDLIRRRRFLRKK